MVLKEIYFMRHGSREDWVNPNPICPTNLSNDPLLSEEESIHPLVEESNIPLFIDYSVAECEWYGLNHVSYHPRAPSTKLKELLPKLDIESHTSSIPLPTEAESTHACHLRVRKGIHKLLNTLDYDKESPHIILLSGHASTVICAVRAILNDLHYPVRAGTCSLTRIVRQPDNTWKLVSNGDCSHLSKGEQRRWMFSDDIPDHEIQ